MEKQLMELITDQESQRRRRRHARSCQQHNGLLTPLERNSSNQRILPNYLAICTKPPYIHVPFRICFGAILVWAPVRSIRKKINYDRVLLLLYNFHDGMFSCTELSSTLNLQDTGWNKCEQPHFRHWRHIRGYI